MRITKLGILVAIGKIIEKHGGNYSHASTATMLGLLDEHHGVRICSRTYYRHMRDLRRDGLIKSIRRYGREEGGKIYRRTSAVCITVAGYYQLYKVGWKWALSMAKKLRQKFVPKKTEPKQEIIVSNKMAEKKEADTLKETLQKIKKEGISLYKYLFDNSKKPKPLRGSVQAATDKT